MASRSTQTLLLLLGSSSLLALAAEGHGKKKKGDDDSKKQPMPHHSFAVPMEYSTLLDDWSLSGASLFAKDRLLLHPGVPELHGFAWTKQRVLTDDFSATFQFRAVGAQEGSQPPNDQAFAFWYTQDNLAKVFNESDAIKGKTWGAGLRDQGMGFVGSKARFSGVAAVLSTKDKKQQVSLLTNDGSRELSIDKDVPSEQSKEFEFRNTMNPALLQIRVNKKSVKGFFKQSPSLSWQPCFDVEVPQLAAGGYVGFSAWSGSAGEGRQPDLVSVIGLDMANYDETSMGEDMGGDVSKEIQDAYKDLLMDDKRHFADQASQTEHLKRLVEMVEGHAKTTASAEEWSLENIQVITKRMASLGEDCGTLVKEAHLLLEEKGKHEHHDHKSHVESMKNEIIGLRKLLVKDSVTHRAKLDAVQKNVAEVKQKSDASGSGATLLKINAQADDLEKTVTTRGSQMTWMLLLMVAAIVGIGGLMHNRMNYYEKKHFI